MSNFPPPLGPRTEGLPNPGVLAFNPRTADMIRTVMPKPEMLVPPRKPKLVNKQFTSKGGAKLLQPDQEAVKAVVEEVGKLHYFGVADTDAFHESDANRVTEPEFSTLVFRPLIDQIKADFPDLPMLTFRGGMASLNGTQTYLYGHSESIPDVTEIVRNGGDRSGVFNAATTRMDKSTTENALDLHRVTQYACGTSFRRFDIAHDASEVAETLFPVVSVYDSSMLRSAGGNVWAVQPKDGHTAAEALLATYVLDCPA